MYEDSRAYNAPPGALDNPPSSAGKQLRTDYFYRKAIVDAVKEAYFGQLANVRSMPKHMGKTIKQYHYLPILDDRNINDQGIDAQGNSAKVTDAAKGVTGPAAPIKHTISVQFPNTESGRNLYASFKLAAGGSDPYVLGDKGALAASVNDWPAYLHPYLPEKVYFEGMDTTAGAAKTQAEAKAVAFFKSLGITFADTGAMTTAGYTVTIEVDSTKDAGYNYGNMYGSSKDVGTIMGKMPILGERGGRVNRVGSTRIVIEGSLEKFGFFSEYTQESLDFDTDSELMGHITTEAVRAANEITEDQLQIDLLHSAGTMRYAGTASSQASITDQTKVTYDDLVKLAIELDNNRTPKNTKLITGSRMIDTRVVNAARYMYIGSELIPTLMKMNDYHGEAAWLPVAQYAAAGTLARGEQGTIHDFRMIVVPEMMNWEGGGGADGADGTAGKEWVYSVGGKVTVFPMLVVGSGSFTTIGFQTDGKTVKFNITHKKPGREMATREDPFGENGFWSIKWYYGFMPLRPERIALLKTAAEY